MRRILRSFVSKVPGARPLYRHLQLANRVDQIEQKIDDLARHAMRLSMALNQLDLAVRDVLESVLDPPTFSKVEWALHAERQVAADTNDHLFPHGTKNDNTRHPRFVRACEAILGSGIRHLDLGCAGGGLVWDFTRRGHLSVGVEGSDFSLREQRAAWRTIPDRLFTADICYPFHFTDRSNARVSFDVISAWELFEHIPEAQLPGLLKNVTENLRVGGFVTASIATVPDNDEARGIAYHPTVQPREWWEKKFRSVGLVPVSGLFETGDFVRGVGNPTAADGDVRANPESGFHIALRHDPATASA
jgi:2-polyprenyl-3-methyl-5-hydroxy-6-metoxy-1,4-benzoquinol methylase